jgi:hypothetical protein
MNQKCITINYANGRTESLSVVAAQFKLIQVLLISDTGLTDI